MRPNYAQDAPPTALTVGGFSYNIESDFRVWIEVMRLLRQLNFKDTSVKGQARLAEVIEELETLVFGGILEDESITDVLEAIGSFAKGYPSAPMSSSGSSSNAQTYSFEYDLNEIIIAIQNQHHVDLSWKGEKCHWWIFLLYFHTLSGEHYILNLMQARGYTGKDKDMIKRRNACALPIEYTAEEQMEIDAFNALFDTPEDKEEDNEN